MAKSIPGQSSMFDLTISGDSCNVIFSPESEDGRTPYDSPAGLIVIPPGRSHARVRSSRARVEADRLRLICGRSSGASWLQVGLAVSLASRLPKRGIGSTAYALTWRPWDTRSGRRYCRLSLSVKIMRDLGSTLSATPTETGNQSCPSMQKWPGCQEIETTPQAWCRRMGYPLDWLLAASAIPSFHKSRRSS